MPLPPLITTTPEGRRVYPCDLVINKQKLTRLIIDPHFEENHGSYVNDELIWELVQQLNNRTLFPDPPKRESAYQYFTIEDIQNENKSYCLVWCWKKESKKYIGIVNCY
jgi:hypothetical protein